MKNDIHFLSYLAHLLIKLEMFQTKVVEKIKTRILGLVFVFSKIIFFRKFRKLFSLEQDI
jgi:hypothetical protein